MPNPAQQFSTFQATNRKAEEISCTHGANGDRGKVFERGSDRQQYALQPLSGQQDRDAD